MASQLRALFRNNSLTWEKEVLDLLRKNRHVEHYEGERIARDGRHIEVSMTISPVLDAAGTLIGAAKIARDITEQRRAGEALRKSEELFRIAAETANDVVYEWDLKQRVEWFGKVDKLLAYDPGEFPRTLDGWAASLHPEDKERTITEIQAHLEGRAPYATEYRVRRKDGVYRWWSARGATARTPNGKPVRWIGSVTDITDRRMAEETLRENEAKLRTLVANIPQKILMKDRNCKWVMISENLAHDFGLRPEEVVGKVDAQLFTPDLAAKYHADDLRIMESGRTEELEERYLAGGLETWINTIKTPVRSASGLIVGVLGIFWDVTERRMAATALRESEERFRSMANSMPQLAWVARADGFIYWYNRRWYEYTGTKPEQVEGWGWQIVHDPAVLPKVMENWTGAIASGQAFEMSFPLRGADGRFRTFLTRMEPLKDSEGRVAQWFGTNTDVETLKQAEEKVHLLNDELEQRVRDRTAELEASNKELEAFSYSVSHDLRAPLRAMDGFSMALLEDSAGKLDETAQGYLRRIRAGSQRMATLIDDLLNLSRITRARMLRENVDLTAMAEEIGGEFKISAGPAGRAGRAPAMAVHADGSMLRVVLNNLLGNAWKFTAAAQARIEVGAQERDGKSVFFVRDNGAGFDMAYVEKLFNAFQRLHSA